MAKKLTKKQQWYIDTINAYLQTTDGKTGIILDDNDETYMYVLKSIWHNATGTYILGREAGRFNKMKDIVHRIHLVFNAAKRGDEDFALFVDQNS